MQARGAETDVSFGEHLRWLRQQQGLSLRQLATRVCYTFSYLSKLENGSKPPVMEVAEACDAALEAGHELVDAAVAQARRDHEGWQSSRPAQLPAGVADFVGRDHVLEQLETAWRRPVAAGAPRAITVEGAPGAGKTSLALRWAHAIVERFPDGQLAANLHGYDHDASRADPADVLEEFLRALGLPSAMMPVGIDERAALFRSHLEGRRMLILLDNVAASEQVLPLLPGTSECLVVVTTRARLSGLSMRAGASRVTLEELSTAEARTLLRHVVADGRVDVEPHAVEVLAKRCGHLPLALRVAAERVAMHPHHSVADLVRDLEAEGQRLSVLSAHEDVPSTRTVFSWSYRDLGLEAARMFRLLGLHPGSEVSLDAAAALADCSQSTARTRLERLTEAHLLEESDKDRYRFHDLLRVYAAECAQADESPAEVERAIRRVLDWYLHSAAAANTVLAPQRGLPELEAPVSGVDPARFGEHDYDAALDWCEREAANLVNAAQQAREHGLLAVAWHMAVVNWNYYFLRKRWNAWIAAHRRGLEAARDSGDRLGEAWCLHNLGVPHSELRRFDDALAYLDEAVRIRRDLDDQWGLGWSLMALGITHAEMGRLEQAREWFDEAIAVFRGIDFDYGVSTALSWLGTVQRKLGHFDEALEMLHRALELFTSLPAADGVGFALVRLGATYQHRGELSTALDHIDRALDTRRDIGDAWGRGEALLLRGCILRDQADPAAARQAWQQARDIFDQLTDPRAADARGHLATLDEDWTDEKIR